MAVTLTIDALAAAVRLGDSTEEAAEITRLLAYASEAAENYSPEAPEATQNEAVIRLAAQMFDQATASRGAYANAMRNSGAARILMPYRIHRAGSTEDAIAVAHGAVGTTGNPVVDVQVSSGDLVITFQDGTTDTHTLPAAGTFGVDQTARDLAGDAQADIDDHETNHPSSSYTDQNARDAARSVVSDWAEQGNGSHIPPAKTSRKIFVATSSINVNDEPGSGSNVHDIHLYATASEWQLFEHLGTSPPYLTLRSIISEGGGGGGGGATLLGSYTGTLSSTAWTDTGLTPTAGKAMLATAYVGANTHSSFTWNGWGMSWFPRTRFDATNATEATWRYNFRTSGSKFVYMGRAANGNLQIRTGGNATDNFSFEFWEL